MLARLVSAGKEAHGSEADVFLGYFRGQLHTSLPLPRATSSKSFRELSPPMQAQCHLNSCPGTHPYWHRPPTILTIHVRSGPLQIVQLGQPIPSIALHRMKL